MNKRQTPQHPIDGQVVAITGAARGIGLATARALIDAGARVAICDLDEVAPKDATATLPGEPLTATVDVTDTPALRGFVDRVEDELGPLDVMINNAGIMPTGDLREESDAVAEKTIAINLTAVIAGTKRALESMVPRGRGRIVTLASMAGESPMPGLATYNASKFGALGFTLATRAEFADHGIEVSAILPSLVDTELTSGTATVAGIDKVTPADVAAAIVDVLRHPRAKAWVPSSTAAIVRTTNLLPERAQRAVARRLGADTLMLDATDREARSAYAQRIGQH